MPLIRIAGLDVGTKRDMTALTSLQVYPEKNQILVNFCYRWERNSKYNVIEEEIAAMHKRAGWDMMGVEINGVGMPVYDGLKKLGVPVKPVTTVGQLSDISKIRDQAKMSKPSMAKLMLLYQKKHIVKYPRNTHNQYIKELIKQNEQFREFLTPAGHPQYRAGGRNDHDDITMSYMIALHLAKRYINIAHIGHFVGPIPRRRYSDMELMMQSA